MHLDFLSKKEMKAIDDLKASYGGVTEIVKAVHKNREYTYRKKMAEEKGFGKLLEEAEGFAKQFPKVDTFIQTHHINVTEPGVATTQVSAWQGCKITHNCMKRLAEDGQVLIPHEMISVMPLSDDYVYNGDLITTLAMCENIMGAKYCVCALVGTPLPTKRFEHIHQATGVNIETIDAGDGLQQIPLTNQGTVFGNLCGVEVSNDNHLVYLDNITRAALETGASFFLNPSWSTIVAACYYARDISDFTFKISMLLSAQNTIQFRMLLNIIQEYLRKNGTTPICEINLGNAVNPRKFIECLKILEERKLTGISLTAHVRINPDLGSADFNWFDNAVKVLDSGCDITIKYESDGETRPDDTMASYFILAEEREAKTESLGNILYHKVVRCDKDAKALMKLGHEVKFARISE